MTDLEIPSFLRTRVAGTPCHFPHAAIAPSEARGPGSTARRLGYPDVEADTVAINELLGIQASLDEVREYERQKKFAEFQQYCAENPELVKMDRKAKRDARRRIAKLGIKATGRRWRSR